MKSSETLPVLPTICFAVTCCGSKLFIDDGLILFVILGVERGVMDDDENAAKSRRIRAHG